MRLPILAATAALVACSTAAQTPPAAPRPMLDAPPAQPPIEPPPATLSDADAACRRGNQPACEQADKIKAKILPGGALAPTPLPAEGGGRR